MRGRGQEDDCRDGARRGFRDRQRPSVVAARSLGAYWFGPETMQVPEETQGDGDDGRCTTVRRSIRHVIGRGEPLRDDAEEEDAPLARREGPD